MKNSYYLLNQVFLLALFCLLFNDLYLKEAFPSFISGKLSDLSGLVVFVLFFTFLAGNRLKQLVFISTAGLFCWWKSSLSTGFIQNWNNEFAFYPLERTVDYTDLFCLLILIPTYYYEPAKIRFLHHRMAVPVLLLGAFAIAATSRPRDIPDYSATETYLIDKSFKLEMTRADFLRNLSFSNITCEKNESAKPAEKASDPQAYVLKNFTIHEGLVIEEMYLTIKEKKKHLVIDLFKIVVRDTQSGTKKELRKRIANETQEYFSKNK